MVATKHRRWLLQRLRGVVRCSSRSIYPQQGSRELPVGIDSVLEQEKKICYMLRCKKELSNDRSVERKEMWHRHVVVIAIEIVQAKCQHLEYRGSSSSAPKEECRMECVDP